MSAELLATRLQGASGLVFGCYLTSHMVNVALGTLGPRYFDAYMSVARSIYQHPVVEVGLAAALVVHIVAGIARTTLTRQARVAWQIMVRRGTGYVLAGLVVGHVYSTRIAVLLGEYAPLTFDRLAVTTHRLASYITFAVCGVVHAAFSVGPAVRATEQLLLSAARTWTSPSSGSSSPPSVTRGKEDGWRLPLRNGVPLAVTGVAAVLVTLGVGALSGWFFPVAPEYGGDFGHHFTVMVGGMLRGTWMWRD